LCLHFLARSSSLHGWSLASPYFLGIGTFCSLLRGLNLLLLLFGRLCIPLLPLLGSHFIWPFVYLCWLSLACSWFLGHLDFWRLHFSLLCLFLCCSFRHFLSNGWNPPLLGTFADDHVNITLYDVVVHLEPLFLWIILCLYPHCLSRGLEFGDICISRDNFWCNSPHLGDGFL
jgi:hypothetical protein